MKSNDDFFYYSLCHVCKEPSKYLKRCASCKTIAYCSKSHQELDWNYHRKLCKAIVFSNSIVTYKVGCTIQEWKEYRIALNSIWTSFLKRDLYPYENQMWMFPRMCAKCYSKTDLFECSQCLSIAYCSRKCSGEGTMHSLYCHQLKTCMDVDIYLHKHQKYPEVQKLSETFFGTNFSSSLGSLMEDCFKETCTKKEGDEYIEYVLKSEIIAPASTLLYALNKVYGLSKFMKENFVVHLVGASSTESFMDWCFISEFIFHWIESVKHISWILIGPEAVTETCSSQPKFCDVCISNKKTHSITIYKAPYNEVMCSIDQADVVVAFNSGLHEFEGQKCDTWKESIPCLLREAGNTLILTAYTEDEIKRDVNRVFEECGQEKVQIVVDSQVNPFAGFRPLRDWTSENAVFYVNGYIAVLKNIE